jgi:5-dehydro-2-deoxygluconokinase
LLYHPDDPAELRFRQEERVRSLYAELVALDRRLLLEVICPSGPDGERPVDATTLPRAIRRLYNLGIRPDWWKLQAQSAAGWRAVTDVIRDCDPHCKGIVILGAGADETSLQAALTVAAPFELCRGFAVGRSIFADAAEHWFAGELDAGAAKEAVRKSYLGMIDTWCAAGVAA